MIFYVSEYEGINPVWPFHLGSALSIGAAIILGSGPSWSSVNNTAIGRDLFIDIGSRGLSPSTKIYWITVESSVLGTKP
jgi:hypothetical protein